MSKRKSMFGKMFTPEQAVLIAVREAATSGLPIEVVAKELRAKGLLDSGSCPHCGRLVLVGICCEGARQDLNQEATNAE